jgi:protocatechuate 3,4-dioxygenase beta subunit
VSKAGKRIMATQAMVKSHPANDGDLITSRIKDPAALETLMVEYRPLPGSTLGELTATFDIRLGVTAQELDDGRIGGYGRAQG